MSISGKISSSDSSESSYEPLFTAAKPPIRSAVQSVFRRALEDSDLSSSSAGRSSKSDGSCSSYLIDAAGHHENPYLSKTCNPNFSEARNNTTVVDFLESSDSAGVDFGARAAPSIQPLAIPKRDRFYPPVKSSCATDKRQSDLIEVLSFNSQRRIKEKKHLDALENCIDILNIAGDEDKAEIYILCKIYMWKLIKEAPSLVERHKILSDQLSLKDPRNRAIKQIVMAASRDERLIPCEEHFWYFPRFFFDIEHITSPLASSSGSADLGYHFANGQIFIQPEIFNPLLVFCAKWGSSGKFSTFFPRYIFTENDLLEGLLKAAKNPIARKDNRSLVFFEDFFVVEFLHGEGNVVKSAYPLFGYFDLSSSLDDEEEISIVSSPLPFSIKRRDLYQMAERLAQDPEKILYTTAEGKRIVDVALNLPTSSSISKGIYVVLPTSHDRKLGSSEVFTR